MVMLGLCSIMPAIDYKLNSLYKILIFIQVWFCQKHNMMISGPCTPLAFCIWNLWCLGKQLSFGISLMNCVISDGQCWCWVFSTPLWHAGLQGRFFKQSLYLIDCQEVYESNWHSICALGCKSWLYLRRFCQMALSPWLDRRWAKWWSSRVCWSSWFIFYKRSTKQSNAKGRFTLYPGDLNYNILLLAIACFYVRCILLELCIHLDFLVHWITNYCILLFLLIFMIKSISYLTMSYALLSRLKLSVLLLIWTFIWFLL